MENLTVLSEGRNMVNGFTLMGVMFGMLVAAPAFTMAQKSLFNRRETSPYKGYSGLRLFPQVPRLLYHYDQTIAVIEIGPKRELLNCELIEVNNNEEKKGALKNLTKIAKPIGISFRNMMDLMQKCQDVQVPNLSRRETEVVESRGTSNLLSGVLPGTKWCGIGDVAETYFDLGQEANIDKCCRRHDLCPVKIRGNTSRYNLTNDSIYTKSHCQCDSEFQKCLRAQDHPTADVMGNIYFNLIRVPCVEDKGRKRYFQLPNSYR